MAGRARAAAAAGYDVYLSAPTPSLNPPEAHPQNEGQIYGSAYDVSDASATSMSYPPRQPPEPFRGPTAADAMLDGAAAYHRLMGYLPAEPPLSVAAAERLGYPPPPDRPQQPVPPVMMPPPESARSEKAVQWSGDDVIEPQLTSARRERLYEELTLYEKARARSASPRRSEASPRSASPGPSPRIGTPRASSPSPRPASPAATPRTPRDSSPHTPRTPRSSSPRTPRLYSPRPGSDVEGSPREPIPMDFNIVIEQRVSNDCLI